MRTTSTLFLTLLITVLFGAEPTLAQDQARLDEFTVLMENLVDRVAEIESAYGPMLAGNIARTRRLEVYSASVPVMEAVAARAAGRSDSNSARLLALAQVAGTEDPTGEAFRPVLNEFWVRSAVLHCRERGIGADVVAAYVKRESATFVANRGNFFHPDFDESTLDDEDIVQIYFCGFGLVALVHMDGGVDQAIALYQETTDLRPYFAQQLVFRGADLDTSGLPLLEEVLFDEAISPPAREVFYGVLAGKLIGPAGQFGNELSLSDRWKETVAGWAVDHILTPERLQARWELPFYGVQFEGAGLGPESLLGLIGPVAQPEIAALLASDDLMRQVAGLEALRWLDMDAYPEAAGALFALAEPLMANDDFTLAVLAMSAFESDASYTGEPYDEARRERIRVNIPALTTLMNRAYQDEAVDYLSTTAWLDIFAEGTLVDGLAGCMPMVAQVITVDWARRQAGEEVRLPEGEIELLAHFMPGHPEYFTATSEAMLGFLTDELDSGDVNPFRVWTYVHYLEAAKSAGAQLGDDWISALVRLRAWVDSAAALIRGEELKQALEGLVGM